MNMSYEYLTRIMFGIVNKTSSNCSLPVNGPYIQKCIRLKNEVLMNIEQRNIYFITAIMPMTIEQAFSFK